MKRFARKDGKSQEASHYIQTTMLFHPSKMITGNLFCHFTLKMFYYSNKVSPFSAQKNSKKFILCFTTRWKCFITWHSESFSAQKIQPIIPEVFLHYIQIIEHSPHQSIMMDIIQIKLFPYAFIEDTVFECLLSASPKTDNSWTNVSVHWFTFC